MTDKIIADNIKIAKLHGFIFKCPNCGKTIQRLERMAIESNAQIHMLTCKGKA